MIVETIGVRDSSPQHIKIFFKPRTTIFTAVKACGGLVTRFYDDPFAPTAYRIDDEHGHVIDMTPAEVRGILFTFDTEEKFMAGYKP
jgi:hypothetical protein